MGSMQSAALDKIMDESVAQAAQRRQFQGSNGQAIDLGGAMGSVDVNSRSIGQLSEIARAAFANGDEATGTAAMQSLSRTAAGRHEIARTTVDANGMAGIRTDVFGGTETSTVNSAALGGRSKQVWDKAVSGVNGSAAPDLVKPPSSAYGGVSAADFAAMDYETKGRYLAHAETAGGASVAEASQVIADALASRNLAGKIGNADFDRMEPFASGVGQTHLDTIDPALRTRIATGAAISRGTTPPAPTPTPSPAPSPNPAPNPGPTASTGAGGGTAGGGASAGGTPNPAAPAPAVPTAAYGGIPSSRFRPGPGGLVVPRDQAAMDNNSENARQEVE